MKTQSRTRPFAGPLLLLTLMLALSGCGGAPGAASPTAGKAGSTAEAVARVQDYPTRIPSATLVPMLQLTPTRTAVPAAATPAPTQPAAAPASPTTAAAAAPAADAKPAPAGQAIAGPAVTVTAASANVRSGPGTQYQVIGGVRQGEQYAVTGRVQAGDWWQITYNGRPAWVAASLVSGQGGADQVALVTQLPPTPQAAAQNPPPGDKSAAGSAPPAAPAAPPAAAGGGHIAFASGKGNGSDVALLDVGTGKVSIVASDGRQPSVWTDGHIVFKGAGNGRENLFTVMPDGSFLTQVSAHGEDAYPMWAPTRLGLLYFSTAGGPTHLCLQWDTTKPLNEPSMRVEYIPDKNGTPRLLEGSWPTWLNNSRIAFTGCDSWLQGSNCGIWTLDVDQWRNFRPYPLTTDTQDRPTDAAGETLIFSSRSSGNWEVNAIRWSLPTRKVDPKAVPVNLTNNPAQDFGATYSPDGKSIAFISDRGGWGIWVMNADGSSQRLLAPVPQGFGPRPEEERLSWGP